MRPKIILLDWDGTLADNYAATRAAMNATRADHGLAPLSDDDLKVRGGMPLSEMFPDPEDRVRFADHHKEFTKVTPPQPVKGAREFVAYLQELRKAGIYVGVISNKPRDLVEGECHDFGWDGCFDVMVGAMDTPNPKPDPEPLAKALENYPVEKRDGLRPRDITYIGDTNTDLQFARNTGVRFMGVGERITELSHVCETCADLPQMHKRIQHLMRTVGQQTQIG